MSLKELLEQTKFKKDAKEIARQLGKVGVTTVDRLGDAPALLNSTRIWGHSITEVIAAMREAAADKPEAKETPKPGEAPTSEPAKAAGGIK